MAYEALTAANELRWSKAKFTRSSEFQTVARKLIAAKERYLNVADKTGVPWFVIAVIHQRESGGDFAGVLHNGEKIIGKGRKTALVPAGRGPFTTWDEAAVDALTHCHPFAASNKDWSVGGTLTLLERYNGLGYFNRKLSSPYIWSGTDQYVKGKYIRDHVFDPETVDRQLGCAGLIMAMQKLDSTIAFGGSALRSPTAAIVVTSTVAAATVAVTQTTIMQHVLSLLAQSWPYLVAGVVATAVALLIWRARRR